MWSTEPPNLQEPQGTGVQVGLASPLHFPHHHESLGGREAEGGESTFCGQSGTYRDSGDLGQALTLKETVDGRWGVGALRARAKRTVGQRWRWHRACGRGPRRADDTGKGGPTSGVHAFACCRKFAMLRSIQMLEESFSSLLSISSLRPQLPVISGNYLGYFPMNDGTA